MVLKKQAFRVYDPSAVNRKPENLYTGEGFYKRNLCLIFSWYFFL